MGFFLKFFFSSLPKQVFQLNITVIGFAQSFSFKFPLYCCPVTTRVCGISKSHLHLLQASYVQTLKSQLLFHLFSILIQVSLSLGTQVFSSQYFKPRVLGYQFLLPLACFFIAILSLMGRGGIIYANLR